MTGPDRPASLARPRTALAAAALADDVSWAPDAPNVVTVRHWSRLLDGELLATSPRVEWAKLMRRTHEVDVLRCPLCSGRQRVVAVVTDEESARRVLRRLGFPRAPPPRSRARAPTWLDTTAADGP